jgi:hypothetical protein
MKQFLLITLLLILAGITKAQNNNQQVAVYLKNGGIIKGKLIELIPDSLLKIKTVDSNIFVYKISEISKFTNEPEPLQSLADIPQDTSGIDAGYYGVIEYNIGFSFAMEEMFFTNKWNFINGYRFSPWFAGGIGFGLRSYAIYSFIIPVFADIRLNVLNKKISPYIAINPGYGFQTDGYGKGGFMVSVSFGIFKKIKNRCSLNIGLSYEMQRISEMTSPAASGYGYGTVSHESINSVGFLFGFGF